MDIMTFIDERKAGLAPRPSSTDACLSLIESIDQRHFRSVMALRILEPRPQREISMSSSAPNTESSTSTPVIAAAQGTRLSLLHDLSADWRRWSSAERLCAGMAGFLAASALLSRVIASIGFVP